MDANASEIYVKETIRIHCWNKYLAKTSNAILKIFTSKKIRVDKKKIIQVIINFNTLLIGISYLPDTVFFPNQDIVQDYQSILFDELGYHAKDESILDKGRILTIIIDNLDEAKRDFTNQVKSIKEYPSIVVTVENDRKNKDNVRVITGPEKYRSTRIIARKYLDRLNRMFVGEKKDDSNLWIAILLLRYTYYTFLKTGICFSVADIYRIIKKYSLDDKSLEAFAGSLNSNLKNYCSLFFDIEKYFGSKGSFLTLRADCKYEIIIANPPYVESIIEKASNNLIEFMDRCDGDKLIIFTIPDWRSETEFLADVEVELDYSKKKTSRSSKPYVGYDVMRQSKYFQKVYHLGKYKYHNFFDNVDMAIGPDTLILLLCKETDNKNFLLFQSNLNKLFDNI